MPETEPKWIRKSIEIPTNGRRTDNYMSFRASIDGNKNTRKDIDNIDDIDDIEDIQDIQDIERWTVYRGHWAKDRNLLDCGREPNRVRRKPKGPTWRHKGHDAKEILWRTENPEEKPNNGNRSNDLMATGHHACVLNVFGQQKGPVMKIRDLTNIYAIKSLQLTKGVVCRKRSRTTTK